MFKNARIILCGALITLCVGLSVSAEYAVSAGVVNAGSGLKLRTEANTSCDVLSTMPEGSDLTIIAAENGFYKVSFAGIVGYGSAEYITAKDIMNVNNGGGVQITASVLNMRSAPDINSDILAKLPEGSTATIIGINNGWLKVTTAAGTGYISPEFVSYIPLDGGTVAVNAAESSSGARVVDYAKQYLGTPYVYGGSSPRGFDCSGFTQYVYKQFGISLNRTSSSQISNGVRVSKGELQAGDLVFFSSSGSSKISHVGLYTGGGNFIHSVKAGTPVSIDTLNSGYYSSNYVGATRVL